jgi:hypothetical protein
VELRISQGGEDHARRSEGIVNLLVPMPSLAVVVGGLSLVLLLRDHGRARDFLPVLESLGHLLAVRGSGKPMPSRSEVLGNRTIRGEETLGVPGRLKSLHPLLPLARGLMRILGAVIEVAVLAVLHTRENLPLRGAVVFEWLCPCRLRINQACLSGGTTRSSMARSWPLPFGSQGLVKVHVPYLWAQMFRLTLSTARYQYLLNIRPPGQVPRP